MSEQAPSPAEGGQTPPPGSQQISLQQINQQFMHGLQRNFDLLGYNLAAIEAVSPASYDAMVGSLRVMPFAQAHMNHEQVHAYSLDLVLKQTLNDALSMASACLDNCHFFALLVSLQNVGRVSPEEANKTLNERQKEFVDARFDVKFNLLEKNFKVMCELEDALVSYGMALQCLAQNGGNVHEQVADDNKELKLEFKRIEVIQPPAGSPADAKPSAKLATYSKAFQVNQRIELHKSDILAVPLTLASFFQELFSGIDRFTRSAVQAQQAPAPQA